MIANPTHIAIGIYFKPHLSPIPLISVRETNEVALAVRKYAKEIGIPIITDKKLARKKSPTKRLGNYNFWSKTRKYRWQIIVGGLIIVEILVQYFYPFLCHTSLILFHKPSINNKQ